jgi:hypothetical protein
MNLLTNCLYLRSPFRQIQFNTAIIREDGVFIKTRRDIAKEYLTFWFWVDLLATIPWELFVTAKGTGLLPLFKLLRIGR